MAELNMKALLDAQAEAIEAALAGDDDALAAVVARLSREELCAVAVGLADTVATVAVGFDRSPAQAARWRTYIDNMGVFHGIT